MALERCRGLNAGTPRFVLILLALHHNRSTGQCNPSIGRIAEITGHTDDLIKRVLRYLRRSKVIAVAARGRGAGNSNRYLFPGLEPVNGDVASRKIESYGDSRSPKPSVNGTHGPSYRGLVSPRIRTKKNKETNGFVPEETPLPHGEQFSTAWREFCSHRREILHPLKPTAAKRIACELSEFSEADAVKAIYEAITKGWRKPFPKSGKQTQMRVRREQLASCL